MKFIKKDNSGVSRSFVVECSKKFNITPVIMEQIILRGNNTFEKIAEFLTPTQNSFHNPFDLNGMTELVERIKLAKTKNEKVLIFGDFDVDGVSATAIMIKTLRIMGFSPKYYLPNRYIDGYGLTNEVLDKIKAEFNPDLIITVDCGISCWAEVEYAKTIGMEVIVTDHHEIPEKLPNTIVLNAKRPNQKYSFNGLCGTGLAYKISQALIGEQSKEMLPIACIATIADIVPLIDENRAIVYFGLKNLNQLPLGLKHLFKSLGINLSKCTSNEISFKVAPKLNASGRMGDAKDSLKLYLTENVGEIKSLVEKINNHNNNRRDLCSLVEKDCFDILKSINASAPSIILSSHDWDQGILGIICAKLVGKYNRPVFLFTEKDGELIGSARSIRGINIHELLGHLSDILDSYGGHPLAAGLSLKTEKFDEFITRVNDFLFENFETEIFIPKEYYDFEITTEELTPKFLQDIKKLEPTGSDNEVLKMFLTTNKFSFKPMKNYYCHCNLKVDNRLGLVHFNCSEQYPKFKNSNELSIIFELQADSFSKSIRGIVKSIDTLPNKLKNIGKMSILTPLDQLKYLDYNGEANYKLFNLNAENLKVESHFGTAFVVNSEFAYKKFLELADISKITKIDVCSGTENSGLNCLFVYPSSLDFVKGYSKIIFLDPIANDTFISKINSLTKAKIFVPNQKFNNNFFKSINISRDNFAEIYKDISAVQNHYYSMPDVYYAIHHKKELNYSFKDFYTAFLVFMELKLITFNKNGDDFALKINKEIKTDLANSKIYNYLSTLKEKGE